MILFVETGGFMMKKVVTVACTVVALFFLVLATSCDREEAAASEEKAAKAEEPKQETEAAESEESEEIVIGISKFVQHPALDAVEQGIQDELEALGWDNISYDLQNANADANTSAQIAAKFKSDRVDLAVGIATPTAQALVKAIDDIPVIYSAVTDPVSAGLVDSLEKGGENVTGYSDMTPVQAQLEFLTSYVEVDALGHVYTSGETNAVVLANMAKDVCADMGIDFIEATVANSAEVKQAAQSIAGRVDAFYVSTDNTVVSALSSLTDVAMNAGVPVMSADPSSAETYDIFAALGFDYYKHGRATGRLIDRVLDGESTELIPAQFMNDPSDVDQLHINLDVAEEFGIDVPQSVVDRANMIVQDGELIKK